MNVRNFTKSEYASGNWLRQAGSGCVGGTVQARTPRYTSQLVLRRARVGLRSAVDLRSMPSPPASVLADHCPTPGGWHAAKHC